MTESARIAPQGDPALVEAAVADIVKAAYGQAGGAHALDRLKSDAARARPSTGPIPPLVADARVSDRVAEQIVAGLEQASKHDGGKLRLDLLPTDALELVAQVLTHGAAKYGDRNWEAGLSWRRVDAALERHLFAWRRGEERDAESGLPHLAHAACCALFLVAYAARGDGVDDRAAGERRRAAAC